MNATALTHCCPKCAGTGAVPFRHVENGVCFLCNGAKAVTERVAASWLAAQLGPAPVAQATPNAAPARPSKTVTLDGFGAVKIIRLDDGTFNASGLRVVDYEGEVHEYHLFFAVKNGRVTVDQDCIQHGMRRDWRRAEAALQAALKA